MELMLNQEQAYALENAFVDRLTSGSPPTLPHGERNRISRNLASLRLQEGSAPIIVDVAEEDIQQLQFQVENYFFWAAAVEREMTVPSGGPYRTITSAPKSQRYHLLRECLQDRSLEIAVWRACEEDLTV